MNTTIPYNSIILSCYYYNTKLFIALHAVKRAQYTYVHERLVDWYESIINNYKLLCVFDEPPWRRSSNSFRNLSRSNFNAWHPLQLSSTLEQFVCFSNSSNGICSIVIQERVYNCFSHNLTFSKPYYNY